MKVASFMHILILETETEEKKKKLQRLNCPVPMIKVLVWLSISELRIFNILTLNGIFQKRDFEGSKAQAFPC